MNDSEYLPEITEIVRRLGAPLGKEEIIARQVLKRAPQLARERQITEVEAVRYLLTLINSGAQGVVPPEMAPIEGSARCGFEENEEKR